MPNPLPTFMIIGAMKAGTTSLHRYLAQHPDVSMSSPKEPNFFGDIDREGKDLEWYMSLFDPEAVARGESSTAYTKRDQFHGVPQRIKATIPAVKMIYVVRDPIDRLVSHWIHQYAKGREPRNIDEILVSRMHIVNAYLQVSKYAYQLDLYYEHFPREQILIIDSDDLRNRREETLANVFEFIGVRTDVPLGHISDLYNRSANRTLPSVLERRVGKPRVRRLLRPLLPDSITERQKLLRPQLSEVQVSRLREALQTDVERLREMTGKPFAHWSV
jgi:hypothetical protein